MPYQLRKSDGSVLVALADGTVSSATSLTFIGKNVSNFGALQNENFLYLLENFAANTPPLNPLNGQLWYDTQSLQLKVRNSVEWAAFANMDYQSTQPTGQPGYFWFNTKNNQLYVNTGSNQYSLVGREGILDRGLTRMASELIPEVSGSNAEHSVIKIIVEDEVVGIISTSSFVPANLSGFNPIVRGINLKNASTNDFPINGRAFYSNLATSATNLVAGTTGSLPYQTAPGITSYLPIATTSGYLLTSVGTLSPQWSSPATFTVAYSTTATNLVGGKRGSLPYQFAEGKTDYLSSGTFGNILTQGADGPIWTNPDVFKVEFAGKATTSTNLDGGNVGSIPYQTGTGQTTFANLGNTGTILVAGPTEPVWTSTATLNVAFATTASYTYHAGAMLGSNGTDFINANTSSVASTLVQRDGQRSIWVYNVYGNEFTGNAMTANYADLAEKYLADAEYEPGTVIAVGGTEEVTACSPGDRAIGVVSTDPAFKMNSELEGGTYIALKGRVPCKVMGPVQKGNKLVAGSNGHATIGTVDYFAIALENSPNTGQYVIEVLVL